MKRTVFVPIAVVIWMVLGLWAVLSDAPALAGADGNGKIESVLADQLAVDGQADFIVRFAEQADLTPAYAMDWAARGEFVYNTLMETAQRSQAQARELLDAQGVAYQAYIAGNELYVQGGSLDAANALAALGEVHDLRATRTYQIDPAVAVNPYANVRWAGDYLAYRLQVSAGPTPDALAWGIAYTKADQFWSTYLLQGNGMVVANIDTGVQWDHPALAQSFRCGDDPTDPACWYDPTAVCGAAGACDNNGHGTHTMGSMVGDDDPTLAYQAGMAPNARWIACKGCENTSCSDAALLSCADWILAPGGNPANRPHVVNNSWGDTGGNDWFLDQVNAWRAAGIFPAFSAGNSGPGCSTLGSPGDYQEAFNTAAVASSGLVGSFSSRGPGAFGDDPYTKPNIAAPGVAIPSAQPGDNWGLMNGTSMASPHTAGAVALLWSCAPGLVGQIDETFQLLQGTAAAAPAGSCGAPEDGEGNYTYGYGYLDVLAAGAAACEGVSMGTVEGHVYDESGNPLSGATLTADWMLDSAGIEASTDPSGYYSMTLPVGLYDMHAYLADYASQSAEGVKVVTHTVTMQDFYLQYTGSWQAGPDLSTCFDLTRLDAAYYPATGLVYILGGRNDTATDGSIYAFNPQTGGCADTGVNMATPVSNYTIARLNNGGANEVLCTFGGRPSAGGTTPVVQCYDPVAGTAANITSLPAAFNGFTPGGVAVVDNMAYIFGGFNGGTTAPYVLNVTFRYDPLTNTFTQIGTLGLGRAYIQVAVVDGKIYAFGGNTFVSPNLVAQTYAEVMADPGGAGTWAPIAALETPSGEGRAFGFDSGSSLGLANKIVLAGGGIWAGTTNAAVVYDVASDRYDNIFPDLLQGRRDFGAAFIPLETADPGDGLPGLWVFGGFAGADTGPYGGAEYFSLPTDLYAPDNPHGLVLSPALQHGFGEPGAMVSYTLRLTNTGTITDTYLFTTTGGLWETTLPAAVVLEAGETAGLVVTVTIPLTAQDGLSDVVTVTVTIEGEDGLAAEAVLNTQAVVEVPPVRKWFLPLVFKPQA